MFNYLLIDLQTRGRSVGSDDDDAEDGGDESLGINDDDAKDGGHPGDANLFGSDDDDDDDATGGSTHSININTNSSSSTNEDGKELRTTTNNNNEVLTPHWHCPSYPNNVPVINSCWVA